MDFFRPDKRNRVRQTETDLEAGSSADPRTAPRILLAGEDLHKQSKLIAPLKNKGFDLEFAATPSQASDVLLRLDFHVAVVDLFMRDEQGALLLDRLHAERPGVPVVVLSDNQEIGIAIDTMRRGAFDYVLKPLRPEQLRNAILRAIEHREAIEKNQRYRQRLEQVVQARTEMLRQAVEDLENSYDITLEALGDALDLKDSETEGHSKRVTAYTIALARAMGIHPAEIKIIARGAFLHDIGKMAIPDSILRKPGALTPEEQATMKEHCELGYNILRKIPFLSEAAEIVLSHQEFFDGSGYPNGLRGAEIPIGARIFAIADTLDAITSDRPYRKARSFEVAREEIARYAGRQFDPAVVNVFLEIPIELWLELRTEITSQHRRFSMFDISHTPMPPTVG